jgi:hypothetical protein
LGCFCDRWFVYFQLSAELSVPVLSDEFPGSSSVVSSVHIRRYLFHDARIVAETEICIVFFRINFRNRPGCFAAHFGKPVCLF